VVLSSFASRRSEKPFFLSERSVSGIQQRQCPHHPFLRHELVQFKFDLHDFLDLHQEPRVDLGQVVDLVERSVRHGEGVADIPDAFGAGLAQLPLKDLPVLRLLVHAVHADFQAAQAPSGTTPETSDPSP
jgi:hypothetical protein